MRARTLILLSIAVAAIGTAMLAQSWLAAQRSNMTEGTPVAAPTSSKSVLVARVDLKRGQILRPDDMVWQIWPEGGLDKNYLVMGGTRTPDALAGWVTWSCLNARSALSTRRPPWPAGSCPRNLPRCVA